MTAPFTNQGSMTSATGSDVVPVPGEAHRPVVVFVLSHAEEWEQQSKWDMVSEIVHGGYLFRASAMLSCPTAHFSWTDRALVVSVDRAIENPFSASTDADERLPPADAVSALPRQAILARELRQLTGLSAGLLGESLGVSREQFQRWMSGRPISDPRHGQLVFLHTISRELVRKCGAEEARLWWQIPGPNGMAPKVLLQQRLLDAIHRLIVSLPETEPSGLPALLAMSDEPVDVTDGERGDESWSPYESD